MDGWRHLAQFAFGSILLGAIRKVKKRRRVKSIPLKGLINHSSKCYKDEKRNMEGG
ncbi:hypothetical protein LOAG_15976, partial [Loa loa]